MERVQGVVTSVQGVVTSHHTVAPGPTPACWEVELLLGGGAPAGRWSVGADVDRSVDGGGEVVAVVAVRAWLALVDPAQQRPMHRGTLVLATPDLVPDLSQLKNSPS
ncbi:hypothetical protein EYF80_059667 [Liparis tanakae]|uniref:Uncharacterized protein n=1 Tax=Liparis tanakae TaxID=230148 RepID=A0A4Z2EN01_9TELE|nr:hypothetical protein EYF80_059667 [Liparis tanakae]